MRARHSASSRLRALPRCDRAPCLGAGGAGTLGSAGATGSGGVLGLAGAGHSVGAGGSSALRLRATGGTAGSAES
eukprot:3120042-Prymnesium_polylepis.1